MNGFSAFEGDKIVYLGPKGKVSNTAIHQIRHWWRASQPCCTYYKAKSWLCWRQW